MLLSVVKFLISRFKKKANWRDIQGVRNAFEKVILKYGVPNKACRYESVQIGSMQAEWIIPLANPDDNRVLLYFHGGGFATGSYITHRPHVSQLVMHSKIRALVINYRLAPEDKYPAALDDALMAYQWLLNKQYQPGRIAFGGDSAGGGLVVSTLLYLRDHQVPLPKCAICMSPWLDLTLSGASYADREAEDVMLVREAFPFWVHNYIGEADARSPYISPLFGDLRQLPPVYIQVGTAEMLYDDSLSFAKRAEEAGSPVTLDVFPGYFHVFQAFFRLLSMARRANEKIAAFLAAQLPA